MLEYINELEKLSIINLIIAQLKAAIMNPDIAIITVSLQAVLFWVSDPKAIWYAQIIINITATVQANCRRKSIADFIIFGISST